MTHAATWTPFGGSPAALDVLFTNDYSELYDTEGNRPMLRAPSSLLVTVAQGDAVSANGTNYQVAAVHRDTPHPGETSLALRKV